VQCGQGRVGVRSTGASRLLLVLLQVCINRKPNQRTFRRAGFLRQNSELLVMILAQIDVCSSQHSCDGAPLCVCCQGRRKGSPGFGSRAVERYIVVDDKDRPPAPAQTSGNEDYLAKALSEDRSRLVSVQRFCPPGSKYYRQYQKQIDAIDSKLDRHGKPERVRSAKLQPAAAHLVEPPHEEQPNERDQAILTVIARGSEGLQYCRELDNAGVRPPKKGVWKGCSAGTYAAAYKLVELWPHRIQDEKSKLKRKYPELAQLASE